jgi:hypothetical protein
MLRSCRLRAGPGSRATEPIAQPGARQQVRQYPAAEGQRQEHEQPDRQPLIDTGPRQAGQNSVIARWRLALQESGHADFDRCIKRRPVQGKLSPGLAATVC